MSIQRSQGKLESTGGGVHQRLFRRAVEPTQPKAVLAFVHGLAEHSGRYLEAYEHLAGAGYACLGIDLRGHGQSSGRRLDVSSFDEFHGDVEALRSWAEAAHPGLPLFLVGHSMGGLLVLHHALENPRGLAGGILSSPALALHPSTGPSWLLRVVVTLAGRLVPRVLIRAPNSDERVTRNPEAVASRQADPLIVRRMSPRWLAAFSDTMKEVAARPQDLAVPALVMQSGADLLVDPESTRQWTEKAPHSLAEGVVWEGLYHEMFNEPERYEVFRRMEAWLEQRLSASPRPLAEGKG